MSVVIIDWTYGPDGKIVDIYYNFTDLNGEVMTPDEYAALLEYEGLAAGIVEG